MVLSAKETHDSQDVLKIYSGYYVVLYQIFNMFL